MEKLIIDIKDGEVLNVLLYDCCKNCIEKCRNSNNYASVECTIDKTQKRIGYAESKKGAVWACDNKLTTRNFKIELQNALDCIPQLSRFREEVTKSIRIDERRRMDRVIHNLKTQNAHAIQELTNFIDEEQFAYDIRSVIKDVQDRIKTKIGHAAYTLLRLGKINTEMSSEIFIYEHIMNKDSAYKLSKRRYDLHDVLMLVMHEFMPEFNAKNVVIKVDEYEERVIFDFTIIRFIFFHLIANAVKYIKPASVLSVAFSETNTHYSVTFKMTSYHMYQEDIDNMYVEGYSGKIAIEQKTSGQGLGMHLVGRMAELHNVAIVIRPGEECKKFGKVLYSENEFEVQIPKE